MAWAFFALHNCHNIGSRSCSRQSCNRDISSALQIHTSHRSSSYVACQPRNYISKYRIVQTRSLGGPSSDIDSLTILLCACWLEGTKASLAMNRGTCYERVALEVFRVRLQSRSQTTEESGDSLQDRVAKISSSSFRKTNSSKKAASASPLSHRSAPRNYLRWAAIP